LWLIVGYANLRKRPIRRERITVNSSCRIVLDLSEKLSIDLSHSVIFIAGNAIKTNIAIEKTSVTIISFIIISHKSDE
jgi:hypothetical protein